MKKVPAILTIALLATGAFAQSTNMPAALPFLSSRAALRAFAIESARQTNLELKSPGMEGTWGTGGPQWEGPQRAETILNTINEWRFTFEMENPADFVEATAEIKNSEYDTLFSAKSWGKPETYDSPDRDPAYRLPELFFYFELEKLIPFKVDRSIQKGQIWYLSEDGKTLKKVDITVKNGKVFFKTDFAGKAFLILWDNQGNKFIYNLRNEGRRIPITRVDYKGSRSYIENLVTYNNPSIIDQQVSSRDGVGENPTLEINMDSGATVSIRARSNEGAIAIGFQVRAQGSTNWVYHAVVHPGYFPLPLIRGTSYVVPVWNENEFKEVEPFIPEDEKDGYDPKTGNPIPYVQPSGAEVLPALPSTEER